MKNVTRDMIKTYRINKLKYDFMGYTFNHYEDSQKQKNLQSHFYVNIQ